MVLIDATLIDQFFHQTQLALPVFDVMSCSLVKFLIYITINVFADSNEEVVADLCSV